MNISQEGNFVRDVLANNPKHQELQQEVETVQPKSDPGQLSSNEITKRMDSESNQVRAELSSGKKKKKRKKHKREHDFLDKSEHDQGLPQEVDIASSKRDQCQLSSNGICETMDFESNQVGRVLRTSKKIKGKMQNSEQDVPDKNGKVPVLSPELVAVQPKDMCPQSSNDLIKKMVTESYHVDAELCSSNKKKRKKKKEIRGNNVTDKIDELAIVQLKRDTFLQSPANECSKLEVMNHGQEAAGVQSVLENAICLKDESTSEVEVVRPSRDLCPLSSNGFIKTMDTQGDEAHAELTESNKKKRRKKTQKRGNNELDKSDKDHDPPQENENTLKVDPLEPNRDMCPPSSNEIKEMDKESRQVDAEFCSSSKKKRKRKNQKMENIVLDKNLKDKDFPEKVVTVQPKQNLEDESLGSECLKLEDTVRSSCQEASGAHFSLESSYVGLQRDGSLMPGKQRGSLKNAEISEHEAVQPKNDLCPPSSNDFISNKDAEIDQIGTDVRLSKKRTRKKIKQKSPAHNSLRLEDELGNIGQEAACVQSGSEVLELGSRRENSLIVENQSDFLKNENAAEVQEMQPIRDLPPLSSNYFIEKMDTESNQVNADLSTSSKKKRRKRKRETGNTVLNQSDKDQDLPEVVIAQPKGDLHIQSPHGKCLTQDEVKNYGQVAVSAQTDLEVAELGSRKGDSLMPGKQSGSANNENTSGVEVVEPNRDLPPLSSVDFIEKIKTESDQVNDDLSTNKKKRKKKKREKGNDALNQSDKDQGIPEEVVIAQHGKCLTQDDEVKNYGQVTVSAQTDLEVAELGSRKGDSLMPGKQSGSANNENTSGVEVVQPNRDLPPLSSDDFIEKIKTKSDKVNDDKKRKKKKREKGNNALDQSDKDQSIPEEVVITQPERDLHIQSPHGKCLIQDDEVKNYGQVAVSAQTDLEVAELGSRKDDSSMPGKQSGSANNENTSGVEVVQPNRDLPPLSSDNFIEKINTESDQVNADLSTNKKKRKKKKREKGNNALNQSDKDQGIREEVVITQPEGDLHTQSPHGKCLTQDDEVKIYGQVAVSAQTDIEVAELGSRKGDSLMPSKQSGSANNENTSGVEVVQPNRDLPPLSLDDFIEKINTESDQVNADLSTTKKKRKKKKREKGNNALNQSDKDHDLPEVVIAQPKDLCLQSLHGKCLTQDDEVKNYDQVAVSAQTDLEVAELGSRKDDSLMPGKQSGSGKNNNSSGVEAVQPNRDLPPLSSNDFIEKMDTESNQVNADLSASNKKKRKKRKRETGNNALNQSGKDQDLSEELVIAQPKGDLHIQSPHGKCLTQDDEVKNYGQVAVSAQTDLEVAELGSRKEDSLKPGKQSGYVKTENTSGVEAEQPNRDLAPLSSNDFIEKIDTESDQLNADISASIKKKRKKKKPKLGTMVLDKNDKELDTESVQVKKRKRKREKQKSGNNVLDKVDKDQDQDLPKDLKVASSDMDKFQLGLQCESKLDEIQVMTYGEEYVDKAVVHHGISTSRKKLLILDINGLLADIVPYGNLAYKPDTCISRKAVFKRPFCDDFLHFCFERFNVAVWSSRTKPNVNSAIDFLMRDSKHKLLFCWDQSHCTRTRFYTLENSSKPLVLKELKKVWEKTECNLPWKTGDYNETNTLLVDDSPYKALRNPAYTAIFPNPYQHNNIQDASLGPGGDLRVYLEGLSEADNVQKYVEENPFGQEAITESNQHWHFYSKIL